MRINQPRNDKSCLRCLNRSASPDSRAPRSFNLPLFMNGAGYRGPCSHLKRRVLAVAALALVCVGGSNAWCADEELAVPAETAAGQDWREYNKSLDGQRYSALSQINRTDIGSLKEVCRIRLARRGAFPTGPVVIGNTMYVTEELNTFALNATTCAVRWKHIYELERAAPIVTNRGVAFGNGRVYRGTGDARVIALDAATGKELWRSVVGDASHGEGITGAPIFWNGLVFTGIMIGDFGVRGRIVALDAATGREVWRFDTIPVGNEVGAKTWKNARWARHGGGGSWSSFALDPATAELFVPVGNPAPDFAPGDRPGANLFTDSVVVLDARTGALKWWYQLVSNDSHDFDIGAAPILFRDKRGRDEVAVAGKDGYLYVIDRESRTEQYKVATTTVDAHPRPPTPSGVHVCPGVAGGTFWNGPAFDPLSRTIFVGSVDECGTEFSAPGIPYTGTKRYAGGTFRPDPVPMRGWITAVDADTGRIRWRYHADAGILSGITPTAGGIVLAGDNDGNFLVLNSATGDVLRKIPTGGAITGGVVTYAVDGIQYIAFTSGDTSPSMFGALGSPSIIIMALNRDAIPTEVSAIARGHELYEHLCLGCHASDGEGIKGINLRRLGKRMSRSQIERWIINPAPPMPQLFPAPQSAHDLSDIDALATFLSEW